MPKLQTFPSDTRSTMDRVNEEFAKRAFDSVH